MGRNTAVIAVVVGLVLGWGDVSFARTSLGHGGPLGSIGDAVAGWFEALLGDGKVTTAFPADTGDWVGAMALQADGKIVVAGHSGTPSVFSVSRYNTDGSLDSSFDSDGMVTTAFGTTSDSANAVTVQTDGKIVVAGARNDGSNFDFATARYHTDGSLDTSFGGSGKVVTAVGSTGDIARAVTVQTDGRIVVAGSYSNGSYSDIAVVRYDTDGSLDTGFGANGKASAAVGMYNDTGYGVALQTDGKIVVAGQSSNGFNNDIGAARFNADGSLDTGFDTDGVLTTAIGTGHDNGRGVVVQTDGKIVVAGYYSNGSNYDFAALRYGTDGALDTAFDSDGMVTTAIGAASDVVNAMSLQTDGRIVVTGYSNIAGTLDFATVRYNTDGSLDTAFDTDGVVTTAIQSANDVAMGVALQSDGKMVVAGYTAGSTDDIAVARYGTNGALDSTFDTDGIAITGFISSNTDTAQAIAVQSDGKIVVAGHAHNGVNPDFAVAKYHMNGSLDTSFGAGGKATTTFGTGTEHGYAVAVQTDGKIVVAGDAPFAGIYDFAVVRYDTDGSLDTTFDTDGKVNTPIGTSNEYAYGVVLQTDGKIVAAGKSYGGFTRENFAVVRYNSDGSLDTGFDADGKATADIDGSIDTGRAVALQTDGKIVVAGDAWVSNYDFAVARFNTDGSLDTTFDTDGKVTTAIGSSHDYAYGVALQTDGKIVVAGYSSNGSDDDFALARYDTNGALDTSFDADGIVTTPIGSGHDYQYGVAVQKDGKIVVSGYYADGSASQAVMARYHSDGSLDTGFDDDGIKNIDFLGNSKLYGVVLQPDGRILLAGIANNDFAVARCHTCGKLDVSFGSSGAEQSAEAALEAQVRACPRDEKYLKDLYWYNRAGSRPLR